MDDFQKAIMIGCIESSIPFTDTQCDTFANVLLIELRKTRTVTDLMFGYIEHITHDQFTRLYTTNHFVTWVRHLI